MKNFLVTLIAVLLAGGAIWGLNRNAILWEAEADRIIKNLIDVQTTATEERWKVSDYFRTEASVKDSSLDFWLKALKRTQIDANNHYSKFSIGADTKPLSRAIYDAQNEYEFGVKAWRKLKNEPWQDQAVKFTGWLKALTENLLTRPDFDPSSPVTRQELLKNQIGYAEEHLGKFPEGADKTEIEAAIIAARKAIDSKNELSTDGAD